ncbi:MAG TPA: flavin reductase family protein [Bacillota bacterium]|jgi:flavin reductase (DIM6/NTAB) family NADH-FMN oxidoreductase RutF
MTRLSLKPATSLYPQPAVMVTAGDFEAAKNIITLAWVGVACSDPPMVTIGVRPERFTYRMIKDGGEFVINIPSAGLVRAVDICGNTSGKTTDKFKLTGLTAIKAQKVKAPAIAECPVNLECEVRGFHHLGSHDLFIGEVVNITADDAVLDQHGHLDLGKIDPLAYGGGDYWSLGRRLGVYGFSKKS